jgi:hypothetical protein
MADSHANLTNNGLTTNFDVSYDDSMDRQANVIDNANALLAVVENEFTVTTGWFGVPASKFGTGHRQRVKLDLADTDNGNGSIGLPGANNSGYGNPINLDALNLIDAHTTAAGMVENVFMAEWSEVLMNVQGKWNAGDSSGEGLSQFCSIRRFPTGHYSYYGAWVEPWLNGDSTSPNAARSDWVNHTFTGGGGKHGDGDSVSFGCALAFLYYLFTQLQFSETQIIGAGSSTLAGAYAKLTADSGDPFPAFLNLIEHVHPASSTVQLTGTVPDDMFPIALTSFWANKDTFGKAEVRDIIKNHGGVWPQAFWVVVDGFSEASFNALGITVDTFTGSFANLSGIEIIPNLAIDYENAASPSAPQRIRIPFDIKFSSTALTHFPASGSTQYDLATALSANGTAVAGSSTSTKFELVAGADPYFTNIDTTPGDPNRNNAFYLSQDLRVFTATPGLNNLPVPGGPAFGTDSVAGAYTYLQDLLTFLNSNFTDPNGTDPFNGVLPGQAGALQDDSSVTPLTLDMPDPFTFNLYPNYNFAIARVRLLGTSGPAGAAHNVRTFFRLWASQTADTDYQPGTTYAFTPDANNLPGSPLPGAGNTTLPFFATGNNGAAADYAANGPNIRTITIPAGRDSTWAYYGCFLNVYDQNNVVGGQPVQAYLTGTHHCLIAQIADDDAPVVVGATPAASDKLAQRNLQVTVSDNPGPADAHKIPQTFDIRPSDPADDQPPDELMIDWGGIPPGTVASIYWPQVQAADVVALANSLYATHTLTATEPTTVSVTVTGGVSYIPVPRGTGDNFAGLFTLDLPQTVRAGQEFTVLVRRVSTKTAQDIILQTRTLATSIGPEPKTRRRRPAAEPRAAAPEPGVTTWRYVVGSFTVDIPVQTAATMLWPEENTLAILRWRLGLMAPGNRWYKVLQRYIDLIAARVDGLGGNSGSIEPSPTGAPPPRTGRHHPRAHEYVGKVCEVRYDCFGEFAGFVLATCDDEKVFRTCRRGIERVAVLACRHRLTVVVVAEKATADDHEKDRHRRGEPDGPSHSRHEERIVRITLRQ